MIQFYPDLSQRIDEMAEGDEDFRAELTQAIFEGLVELKAKYAEGLDKKDLVIIQQVRHKLKPTLSMFDLDLLSDSLQQGKEILETEGFSQKFNVHYRDFEVKINSAIEEVGKMVN
ncbi:MAG: hypothetical protein EP311_05870 [Cytophagales bacterium]|uniref:HPt domain-containing protein n=1 Tax=Algoriphagus taiwanensis TaxID=1445656 RepID=A0ABQ6PYF0_9BACT|nr:MAG: hypothetical protein EP311_05870 [Cytophagales bacterium]GMQ32959.1 hypothetical protein Ataiwa_12310 [Algoriphagus taiwanensis]